MKKNDFYIIIAVVTMAAVIYAAYGFLYRGGGGRAVIYVDGEEYGTYSLDKDEVIAIQGVDEKYVNTLVIKDGYADMTYAGCPDQICVRHKPIRHDGEMIVCLPSRIIIEIKGGNTDDIDGVAR